MLGLVVGGLDGWSVDGLWDGWTDLFDASKSRLMFATRSIFGYMWLGCSWFIEIVLNSNFINDFGNICFFMAV